MEPRQSSPGTSPAEGKPSQLEDGLALAGDAFLEWVVDYLEQHHDAVFVTVAQLAGDRWQTARPIATRSRGHSHESPEWNVAQTPCAVPATGSPHSVGQDVQRLYPEDEDLKTLNAESYVGVPLTDASGRTLGHVAVLCQRVLDEHGIQAIQQDIQRFLPRLVSELSHLRLVDDFADVVTASTLRCDNDPVEDLLCRMVRTMRVRAGVVALTNAADPSRCRTKAIVRDREPLQDIECDTLELSVDAAGMGAVASGGVRIPTDSGLGQQLLPLRPTHAVTHPLLDSEGTAFGTLTLFHTESLGRNIENNPLLKVVATRIATELERQRQQREQQHAERHALETQRLESLGMLAGGVAHDFNNLLVGVLGNAELCLDVLADDHPAHERLQQIVRAANAAAGLCHQLLDYAGSRRSQLRPQPIDQIIETMTGLLASICGRGMTIDFQLGSSPMRALADSAQLRQLLLNLVRNSAEAMEGSGGRIVVRTRVRTVEKDSLFDPAGKSPVPAGSYIEMEVADNGPGIPTHVLPRVCEPFFTTRNTSHGLGLAAVDGILRVHKGALSIESKPGSGTKVFALLPLEIEPMLEAVGQDPEDGTETRQTLVVDDSDLVRETTCGLLRAAGHSVISADCGATAVRMAAEAKEIGQPYRAAVIDLVMPGQDGVTTAISVRQHLPELPIVMVTGFATEPLIQRANDVPGSVLLTKPFRQSALLQAIDDARRSMG